MNRFLQALIAISGVVISGLLGYQSLESGRRQQEATMIAVIADQIATLAQTCNLKGTSLSLNAKLIETLSEPSRTTYSELNQQAIDDCTLERTPSTGAAGAAIVQQQQQQQQQAQPQQPQQQAQNAPPLDIVRPRVSPRSIDVAPAPAPAPAQEQVQQVQQQMANARGNFVLRGKEIEIGGKAAKGGGDGPWYAVLSSYVDGEEKYVADDVAKFSKRIADLAGAPAFKLEVYRTKISRTYAVVLRPEDGRREGARDLAAKARELGLASDAFVQEDRGWILCGAATSAEQVKACGARS